MTHDPTTLLAEARGLLREALDYVVYAEEVASGRGFPPTLSPRIRTHLAGAAVPPDEGRLSEADREAMDAAWRIVSVYMMEQQDALRRATDGNARAECEDGIRVAGEACDVLRRLLGEGDAEEGDDGG